MDVKRTVKEEEEKEIESKGTTMTKKKERERTCGRLVIHIKGTVKEEKGKRRMVSGKRRRKEAREGA